MQAEKHIAQPDVLQEQLQTMAARMAHLQPENAGTNAAQATGCQVYIYMAALSSSVSGCARSRCLSICVLA